MLLLWTVIGSGVIIVLIDVLIWLHYQRKRGN